MSRADRAGAPRRARRGHSVLIVGAGSLGRFTGEAIALEGRHHLIGYVQLPSERLAPRLPAPILGSMRELEACLRGHALDEVYVAGDLSKDGAAMREVVHRCEDFGIPFALPACPFRFARARPKNGKAYADGYVHYVQSDPKPMQELAKRAMDVLLASIALLLLSPLLLFAALAVKLGSRGPMLFAQERVGLRGRTFKMLKFRTMVVDAEQIQAKLMAFNEQSGPVFKLQNDPRVTRVGRFLRKHSIDELPQLWNVVIGEMSIVGPRPPLPREVAKYEPWQRRRLSVRPGLTCVWQVSGRNQIGFEQWMYLDMRYIDHWSLAQDLSLIAQTVPVVITGKGAS